MKNTNRGRYGDFTTRTPQERKAARQEKKYHLRNGPVETRTIEPDLNPDIDRWNINQYFDYLETLTEDQLKTHLSLDPNKPASTREEK
jgi:hypothetical protein